MIAGFRPAFSVLILVTGVVAALLEGVGMSFLIPIVRTAQAGSLSGDSGGLLGVFADMYAFIGAPFTLEYLILGVVLVITVRYAMSFTVAALRARLRAKYIAHLQKKGFQNALDARIGFFEEHGSDEALNAIVTQTFYAGRAIKRIVQLLEQSLLSLLYLGIAFYLSPMLTLTAAVLFGGVSYTVRHVVETGYDVGGRVADANEHIQDLVQAGIQGISPVKLFNINGEVYGEFSDAVDQFEQSTIELKQNDAMVASLNQLMSAVMVFLFVYLLLRFTTLSFSEFALFMFAMFRLAPRISTLNKHLYQAESDLPHVIRTNEFIQQLDANRERDDGNASPGETVGDITFDDISFSYGDEPLISGFDVTIEQGQFVAFAGPSGAGKSTVISLLARMYDPDSGEIRADGTPIREFDLTEWRSRLAVVEQNPYVFNATLRYNLTVGHRDATEEEIRRVCEIAKVDEFLEDLPEGLDTGLGENGAQLSGGQRQRVALARALLKEDAEILVLDEATSNLDSDLEAQVQAEIERMEDEYTVIAIAHRLSSVKNADRIHVVEDGDISESGTHQDLIAQQGTYASLYATQISSESVPG